MMMPMRVAAGLVRVGDCELSDVSRRRIEDLRQAEVEHFHRPVSTHFDIRGLQVAVNDPVIVGRFERFRDLPGDRPRFIERKRALDETVRQSDPVDQFEDQRTRAL